MFFFGGLFPLLFFAFVMVPFIQRIMRFRGDTDAFDPTDRRGEPDRILTRRVFGVAKRMGGRITISDVVLETGLSIREAEAYMDGLADGMRVRMEVDSEGIVIYEFPEFRNRGRGLLGDS